MVQQGVCSVLESNSPESQVNPVPQAPINDVTLEPTESKGPPSDGYSAPDIPALLWNKKWWIALAGVIGIALGQLAYLKFGPMYESKGEVLVARTSITPIRDRDGDPINIGDRGEHIALILSPLIIDTAVKNGNLDQLPSIKGAPDPSREIIDFLKVRRRAGQDRSVLNVLELTYLSPRKGDGPKVVQCVIDAYRDYLKSARSEAADEVYSSYEEAERLQYSKIDELTRQQVKFRESTPLFWKTPPGVQGSTADLTNVEQEKLLKIDLDRRDVQSKMTEADSKIQTLEDAIAHEEPPAVLEFLVRRLINLQGGAAGDSNRIWESLSSRLVPLIDQEQKLIAQGFDEGYPELKAVRQQIEKVREFYRRQGVILPEERPVAKSKEGPSPAQAEIVLLYVGSLKKEKTELQNRLAALDELYEDTFRKAKDYAAMLLQDQKYNDDIKGLKEGLSEISKKKNGVELGQKNGGYSMKQIAPVSEEIQAKRYIQFLGMGAIFLMSAAFGLFYVRTIQDNTIKSAEDLRTRFGLNAIGQIPQFDPSKIQVASGSRLDPSMVYVHRSGSQIAEAYRAVRTALFFSTQGQGHQVFQITSAEPNDGKTTLAGNLAAAIANAGKTVLLIDGDLRRPRVHECFGDRQRPGLADILIGAVRYEEVIHQTEVNGLSLMCSGTIPANPSEILGSSAYDTLIQQMRERFDYIIVDSPPILAVSDPCVLSRQTNGMIVVFRQGKNRLSAVRHTIDLIRAHGIHLLGAVFNGVELPEDGSYGYSYPYTEYLSDAETKPRGTFLPQTPREPLEV